MGKTLRFILNLLEKFSGKKFFYYTSGESNAFGKTAVKSAEGFWYCGNVLDRYDIAYGILNNGVVEPEETKLVKEIINKLLEKGSLVFYDVGANTGYYGILAAFLGKGRTRLYSFEPLKNYRECLKESIYLNRLENNFNVFDVALGNSEGIKDFYVAGSGSSLSPEFVNGQYNSVQEVAVTKLDTVITQNNLLPPDFIKIDVEGGELPVLAGGEAAITASLPVLFVEIARTVDERNFKNKNFEKTFDFLNAKGYEPYAFFGGRWKKYSYRPGLADGVAMYLFLHKQKHEALKQVLYLN